VARLGLPTSKHSYLRGERDVCAEVGMSDSYLDEAEAHFDAFGRNRRAV
jgi:hypothetical protein